MADSESLLISVDPGGVVSGVRVAAASLDQLKASAASALTGVSGVTQAAGAFTGAASGMAQAAGTVTVALRTQSGAISQIAAQQAVMAQATQALATKYAGATGDMAAATTEWKAKVQEVYTYLLTGKEAFGSWATAGVTSYREVIDAVAEVETSLGLLMLTQGTYTTTAATATSATITEAAAMDALAAAIVQVREAQAATAGTGAVAGATQATTGVVNVTAIEAEAAARGADTTALNAEAAAAARLDAVLTDLAGKTTAASLRVMVAGDAPALALVNAELEQRDALIAAGAAMYSKEGEFIILNEAGAAAVRTQVVALQEQQAALAAVNAEQAETAGALGNIEAIGARMVIRMVLMGIVLALGAVVTKSVEAATAFENSMTRLQTLVGVSKTEADSYRGAMADIAVSTGQTADENAKAMFAITSEGMRGQSALDLLKASAEGAAVGLGDQTVVARTAAAAIEAYGAQNLSAKEAIGGLILAAREGNTTVESIASAFGRVLGVAAAVHVGFDDVISSIASFTRMGVSAQEAATGLRSTIQALELRNTKGANDALKTIGMSVASLREEIQSKGLAASLVDIVAKFNAAGSGAEAMAKIIPNIRGLAEVLSNANSQATAYVGISERVHAEMGTALDDANKIAEQNPANVFRQMTAAVGVAAIAIASGLLPQLVGVANAIKEAATSGDLQKWASVAATAFGGVVEIGKVLAAILANLPFLITAYAGSLAIAAAAETSVADAGAFVALRLEAIGAAIAANPVGAAAAAFVLLALAMNRVAVESIADSNAFLDETARMAAQEPVLARLRQGYDVLTKSIRDQGDALRENRDKGTVTAVPASTPSGSVTPGFGAQASTSANSFLGQMDAINKAYQVQVQAAGQDKTAVAAADAERTHEITNLQVSTQAFLDHARAVLTDRDAALKDQIANRDLVAEQLRQAQQRPTVRIGGADPITVRNPAIDQNAAALQNLNNQIKTNTTQLANDKAGLDAQQAALNKSKVAAQQTGTAHQDLAKGVQSAITAIKDQIALQAVEAADAAKVAQAELGGAEAVRQASIAAAADKQIREDVNKLVKAGMSDKAAETLVEKTYGDQIRKNATDLSNAAQEKARDAAIYQQGKTLAEAEAVAQAKVADAANGNTFASQQLTAQYRTEQEIERLFPNIHSADAEAFSAKQAAIENARVAGEKDSAAMKVQVEDSTKLREAEAALKDAIGNTTANSKELAIQLEAEKRIKEQGAAGDAVKVAAITAEVRSTRDSVDADKNKIEVLKDLAKYTDDEVKAEAKVQDLATRLGIERQMSPALAAIVAQYKELRTASEAVKTEELVQIEIAKKKIDLNATGAAAAIAQIRAEVIEREKTLDTLGKQEEALKQLADTEKSASATFGSDLKKSGEDAVVAWLTGTQVSFKNLLVQMDKDFADWLLKAGERALQENLAQKALGNLDSTFGGGGLPGQISVAFSGLDAAAQKIARAGDTMAGAGTVLRDSADIHTAAAATQTGAAATQTTAAVAHGAAATTQGAAAATNVGAAATHVVAAGTQVGAAGTQVGAGTTQVGASSTQTGAAATQSVAADTQVAAANENAASGAGNAAGGGGGLFGNIGSWFSGLGAGAIVGLIGAAVVIGAALIDSHQVDAWRARQYSTEANVSLTSGPQYSATGHLLSDFPAGAVNLGIGNMDATGQKFSEALQSFFMKFEQATGSILTQLPHIELQIKADGKDYAVVVAGQVIGFFQDVASATNAAIIAGLKAGNWKNLPQIIQDYITSATSPTGNQPAGVDPNVVLQNATTLKTIMDNYALALQGAGAAVSTTMQGFIDEADKMRQAVLSMHLSAQDTATMLSQIDATLAINIQAERDALTGHKESNAQMQAEEAAAFNAKKAIAVAQVLIDEQTILNMIATADATAGFGNAIGGVGAGIARTAEGMLKIVGVVTGGSQALVDAYNQLVAVEQQLQKIPDLKPGDVKIPGGSSSGASNAQQLADIFKQFDERNLGAYGKSLAAINKTWDDAEKLAGKNHAALEKINKDRAIEIAELNAQSRADIFTKVRDFTMNGNDSVAKQMDQVGDSANTLIASLRELWKAGVITTQELHQNANAVRAAAKAQQAALLAAFEKTVSDFINAGSGKAFAVTSAVDAVGDSADKLIASLTALAQSGYITAQQLADQSAAIRQAELRQQQDIVTNAGNQLLQELYGYLKDDKDAAKLKYDLTVADLQMRRAELEIELTTLNMSKSILAELDPLIAKVIAGGPALFETNSSTNAAAASSATALSNALDSAVTSLKEFRDSLGLDTALSPYTPMQQFQMAQATYQQTAQLALTGNAQAIQQLSTDAKQYLTAARAYLGSTEGYTEIFDAVMALLNNILAAFPPASTTGNQPAGQLTGPAGQPPDYVLAYGPNGQTVLVPPGAALGPGWSFDPQPPPPPGGGPNIGGDPTHGHGPVPPPSGVTPPPPDPAAALQTLADNATTAAANLGALATGFTTLAQALAAMAASLHGHVPGFALGGVVSGDQLVRVGEGGPEAIIPLAGGRAVPVRIQGGGAPAASSDTGAVAAEIRALHGTLMTGIVRLEKAILSQARENATTKTAAQRASSLVLVGRQVKQ
jgi:hypothetical protein